ncbi:Cationic amino acid transporter 4, vacuolar -like protein [Gossypium arboreum]|uniref:Cationic amino acid transporter 4, vacuolar-like protein n=1 Tax=Gossypium arboreum TaxID=29729 RepID=A0A0B0P2P6_GOSAR|nr:Cationic amino acid transporter 4, vacuolar -like protein [Gossypium arboreum]
MGVLVDSQKEGFGSSWGGLKSLVRRKQVDSAHSKRSGHHQLAKELTVPHLIAIGVGSTIGAGVYILVGTVAREHSGPALAISFLIAGIAAALSAFCYAELASRCPSAGSAYHYSYICVGEGVAWLIGWALILEYTIGGAAVARGISPNLALLFGGEDSLPIFLSRQYIPGLDVVVDPCAAILVFIVTGLLCVGIKESTFAQGIVTTANVCAMIFVIVAGGYLGYNTGWAGYKLPTGYFPFGVDGMLAGSATVFFAYIGFDSVASTAEEVKNPQRDLPLGIATALSICCGLYMLVSIVIVGLVPYYAMDPDTPISSAFASHGMQWAAYIITIGAVTALCSTLMGSLLPQPRILLAMARDGLLPSFFSDVNKSSQVPIKSTLATGLVAATLSFFMDVSQLAGMVMHESDTYLDIVNSKDPSKKAFALSQRLMSHDFHESGSSCLSFNFIKSPLDAYANTEFLKVAFPLQVSVGTLLAFTMVAISVLILRYVPPDEVPFPSSLQESIDSVTLRYSERISGKNPETSTFVDSSQPLLGNKNVVVDCPIIEKQEAQAYWTLTEQNRRKIAGWTIMLLCVGAFGLTFAASNVWIPSLIRLTCCGVGGVLLLSGLIVLTCIDQDDARHNFGHTGGFICPFVPLLPIVCILINVYLLINLGAATWARVSVWLLIGVVVYVFYGRSHSSLLDAVYVPAAHADEIYRSSGDSLA